MHACFYGGGRVTKSIAVIRDLTKTVRTPQPFPSFLPPLPLLSPPCADVNGLSSRMQMKAMTLKVKGRGSGERARRRRHSTAEDEDPQLQGKDASSSASSSAKIAPAAQPHEEEHGGEKKHVHCDKCCYPVVDDHHLAAAEEELEQGTAASSDGEWMAEPEPGVLMTLTPLGDGANYLRRIRFDEEHFPDARAARAWWEDSFDRIVELYSIFVQPERGGDDGADDPAVPVTPCQSEDDEHRQPVRGLIYSLHLHLFCA
jgi:hypothetical protein